MKQAICIFLLLGLMACSDGESVETPSAIDTTQHPNGITGGSVISTDTAAMRADTNARP